MLIAVINVTLASFLHLRAVLFFLATNLQQHHSRTWRRRAHISTVIPEKSPLNCCLHLFLLFKATNLVLWCPWKSSSAEHVYISLNEDVYGQKKHFPMPVLTIIILFQPVSLAFQSCTSIPSPTYFGSTERLPCSSRHTTPSSSILSPSAPQKGDRAVDQLFSL